MYMHVVIGYGYICISFHHIIVSGSLHKQGKHHNRCRLCVFVCVYVCCNLYIQCTNKSGYDFMVAAEL